jgi:phage tail-like protein
MRRTDEKETAMPLPDLDDALGLSLSLELDGVTAGRIHGISGLAIEQDVVEVQEAGPDGKVVVRTHPAGFRSGEVVLSRPVGTDTAFQDWVAGSATGATLRRQAAVVVSDAAGQVVKRYALLGAWARGLRVDSVGDAGGTVLTERLLVMYERVEVG